MGRVVVVDVPLLEILEAAVEVVSFARFQEAMRLCAQLPQLTSDLFETLQWRRQRVFNICGR